MAQSIYEVMDGRKLEVVNGADKFEIEVPSWFPQALTVEGIQELMKTFGQEAVASKAVAQIIIELRAQARIGRESKDTDEQTLVDSYKVEVPRKPKTKMTKAEQAAALFEEMTAAEIEELLKAHRTASKK